MKLWQSAVLLYCSHARLVSKRTLFHRKEALEQWALKVESELIRNTKQRFLLELKTDVV